MPFRNIRPLHILWQEGLSDEVIDEVFAAITHVLWLADIPWEFDFKIDRLGQRRHPKWLKKTGVPRRYRSLDWHIEQAREKSKLDGHLNSTVLLNSLQETPDYKRNRRYELVVVSEPLHWHDTSLRKVDGIGRKDCGAVISVGKYLRYLQVQEGDSDKIQKKRKYFFSLCVQMLTMHELGHVFGLFSKSDALNPDNEQLKITHCSNKCVMWWREDIDMEIEIKNSPFCYPCLAKLKEYFII